MKVKVFALGRGLVTWDFDWYCEKCEIHGAKPATWELAYLAGKFHATVVHGPRQTIQVLEAEIVPEWQTILVAYLSGERPILDFQRHPIPMRLLELLAAAQRGGW